MKFDINNIYIFQNITNRIFVVKNKYYIIENQDLKAINRTDEIFKNFRYKVFITLEKLKKKKKRQNI